MMFSMAILAAAAALQANPHAHTAITPPAGGTPTEAGQSAYAALGEIVAILNADPTTDWSKVTINALRDHLADMDNVTLRANATTEAIPGGARFRVSGSNDVVGSIQRMTRSHFTSENIPEGWTMKTDPLPNGALVTVTSPRAADAARIRALGFFGILTLGGHHQPHHLMIAKGMHH